MQDHTYLEEDNSTYVESRPERDENLTFRESTPEKFPEKPEVSIQETQRIVVLGDKTYQIHKRLGEVSTEADIYTVSVVGETDSPLVLKYYRPGITPKSDVMEILKKLTQSVIRIFDSGLDAEGRFFEIQEYAMAGSLRDYLRKEKNFSAKFLRSFVQVMVDLLKNIHHENLIHRDIKPDNILIRSIEPMDLVLTDFGISSKTEFTLHQTTLSRTIHYAAPESLSGIVAKASDWWSLGLILLEMIQGQHPFYGFTDKVIMYSIVTRNVPGISEIDSDFQPLLKGLLTRDPKKRWNSDQVEQWLAGKQDIPVWFDSSDESKTTKVVADVPFDFVGKKYYLLDELLLAMVRDWDLGVRVVTDGKLRAWVFSHLENKTVIETLDFVLNDRSTGWAEEKFFDFIYRIKPDMELIFRGHVITPSTMVELARNIASGTERVTERSLFNALIDQKIFQKYRLLSTRTDEWIDRLLTLDEECSGYSEIEKRCEAVLLLSVPEYRQSQIDNVKRIFNGKNVFLRLAAGSTSIAGMRSQYTDVYIENQITIRELISFTTSKKPLFIPENRISELHEKIVTIIKQFDACGELRDKLKNINDTLWLYILALLKMKDIPMTAEHYNLLVELDQVLEHVEEKVQEDNRRIRILGAYDSPIQIGNRAVKEKIPEFREHFPFLTVPGHHEYYEIEIPLIFFSVIAGWLIWYNVAGFVDVWNIFRIFDHLTEFFLMCVSPAFATYFLLIQLFTWYLSETKEKEG